MDAVAKSDVFFFVTTICVILLTVVAVVLGAYFVRIIADVKYITKRAKKETDEIADDLKTAREHMKERGGVMEVLSSVFSFAKSKKKKKASGKQL